MPPQNMPSREKQGLDKIRVLEFPDPKSALCGKLLSDMGADVVLVEPPQGAPMRVHPPYANGSNQSLFFWFMNANKRSFTTSIDQPQGRQAFLDLVKKADIVIDPFKPGHLAALGLDDKSLFAANPSLILISVTGFGQTGPFKHFASSDIIAMAMSGLMSLTGDPEREPLVSPAIQGYQVGSLWATIAVQAAVFRRMRTGQGARLDISLQEAIYDMTEMGHSTWLANQETVKRLKGDHPIACPFKVYEAKDGYAFICGQWDQMLGWMEALGIEIGSMRNPDFIAPLERIARRDEVNAAVAQFAKLVPKQDLFTQGAQRGMPCAPVQTTRHILDDEQLKYRDFFTTIPDPRPEKSGVTYPYPSLPFRGKDGPWKKLATAPPSVGQHNVDILNDWASRGRSWPSPIDGPRSLPLEGVKVVDLCWNIAGPTMGRVLADLGATNIKLEPKAGAPSRGLLPFPDKQPGPNRSYTFQDLNRNKLSVTIDMKNPEAAALARKIIGWADTLVENFTAGTVERLGIGYETLAENNPELIMTSLTGYGQEGPRRGWPTFHPTVSSLIGLVHLFTYEAGEPPLGYGNSYMDYISGYIGAIATLDGLLRREITGKGDHIDITFLEGGANLVGTQLMQWTVNGEEAQGEGNRAAAFGAPIQGCYQCSGDDKWIVVTVADDEGLANLGQALGKPTYNSIDTLEQELKSWLASKSPWDAFRHLQEAGVAAGVVSNGQDLAEQDEHLQARGIVKRLAHAELGEVPIAQCPVVIDGERLATRSAAPLLSEHTEHVLREKLGLTDEEYTQYVIEEVV